MVGRSAVTAIVALLAVGVLAVLVELQSPSVLLWTGARVPATSEGGIVYYSYDGSAYTVTDPRRAATDTGAEPVSVYLDPADPTRALPDGPVRWIDGVCVGSWFAAAATVYPIAYLRRRGRRRRREAEVVREAEAILRRAAP
jgi:hypothetical protein